MNDQQSETTAVSPDLSSLVIPLLKGVIYRGEASKSNANQWNDLLGLQARVRDYVAVLGLDLVLDEGEGYAFLRSQEHDETYTAMPRLISRRPLTFPVSLLLALLRKKLAEFDAGGSQDGGDRLVLARDEIVELMRVFLPESSNEAQLMDRVDAHINKVIELGFLRRLKTSGQVRSFEVRRILKAFVDAQWLAEFDARLAAYREQLAGEAPEPSDE
ncbi:MAG: DUF4194 domain-containing protein [Pseudomonadota bacterium]